MTAGKYDFTIEQGATFRRTLTWKDENGELIDLSGCTARLKIYLRRGTDIKILTTNSGEGVTLGGDAGTVELYISDEDTATLDFDTAKYYLKITYANGDSAPLLRGIVTLQPEDPDD